MHPRRPRWAPIIGAVLIVATLALAFHSWPTIKASALLMKQVRPGWLLLAVLAVAAGFFSAGQIYGRVLGLLGHRAPQLWLIAAATVSALLSQSIPAGTVASYAFLTASLRRRGVPAASVALLASLELLTWLGGMLALFGFGIVYRLLLLHDRGAAQAGYPAAAVALVAVGGFTFAATRPRPTLHRWAALIARVAGRLLRRSWPPARVGQIVDELDRNRGLIAARPRQALSLLGLQLIVFAWHSLALLLLLRALGVGAPPLGVLAAYGLALVVSTFTALPGGGGTVEAALTLALVAEGVPAEAALGATILFRLLSFWLLLPLGAIGYRALTAGES
jgi:Mg2+-importing ATPase